MVNSSDNLPAATANSAGRSPDSSGPHRPVKWIGRARVASVVILVGSIIALARLLPVERLVSLLSARVDQLGMWGPAAFGVVYVIAAVLFVPGAALTLAAGAIFGLLGGTVIVSIASTTAAALAFLIGRYLAHDRVQRWATGSPRFDAINRAIGQGGWRVVALLRLSPAVPFSLGNYLFGLTPIRFWPYVLTSWLAMLPGTFLYVYLGYAGRTTLAATGGGGSRSPAQWAFLAAGLVATVAVTVYVSRLAKRAIKEQGAMPDPSLEPKSSPSPQSSTRNGVAGTVALVVTSLALAGCTVLAYAKRSVIQQLFGPPAVELKETYAEKPGGPVVDHAAFDALLKKHVDQDGWVDYGGLRDDATALDGYIESLGRAPLSDLGRDERLALLINAYNAFTLRLILEHYPLKSIKDIPAEQRWDARRWNVGGNTWSLNQIEHEQIRPNFKEPRIHFALVCAAAGCPPLRNEAYTESRVEEQLESQAQYVHRHDRWFQFTGGSESVRLTELYSWYGGDFEQVAGSVLRFAGRYSEPLKAALDAGKEPRIAWIPYDWSLNSKENGK